jgi:RNA polymerase sigma-70 factor (ECF subfamily)
MDERTIVEEARRGRRDAFEELVKMYSQKVFHLAYGFVRDRAAADDLAQEVFIKAYQALPKFRAHSEFGTWLYRVAVNHIKDHLRKTARRKEVPLDELGDGPLAVADSAEEREREREEEERRRLVFRVLENLPPKYRLILTMRDVQGMSYEEVATVLNIAPGTVDSRLHRARQMLRKKMTSCFSREGGEA